MCEYQQQWALHICKNLNVRVEEDIPYCKVVTLIPERLSINRDTINLLQMLKLYEVKYPNNYNLPQDARMCFYRIVADHKGCDLDVLIDEFYDYINTCVEEILPAILFYVYLRELRGITWV